jgi:cell division protein FtsZ
MDTKKHDHSKHPIIKIVGVGGGGSNAVRYMYSRGIKDVEFVVCNTDVQALASSEIPTKLQIGSTLTEGLGAGANPEVGREAAIESREEIRELLSHGTKMLFVTAGMGGGTGTGAAPVIAEVARELGILTIAIVTAPFGFEGRKKKQYADEGIARLREVCDTVLIISNEKLREIYKNLKMSEAFSQADNILATAAKSIAELITVPQEINLDFEDVKTVMRNSGSALMGSGKAEGEGRSLKAAQEALNSPLLTIQNAYGAQKVLLSIMSGKSEIAMEELTEITDYIQDQMGQDALVIFGAGTDETLGDAIRVTIIATGFKEPSPEKKVEVTPVVRNEPKSEVIIPKNIPLEVETQKNVPTEKEPEPKLEKVIYHLDDTTNEANLENGWNNKVNSFNQEAAARIEKLKKLSRNLENSNGNDSFKEKIDIPAYLRRNNRITPTKENEE